ncbi:hypothetical protein GCM10027276_19730 [Comamonas piscis]
MNEAQDRKRPDALVDLYREASAEDAGPSAASSAQILAHARAKAAPGPATTPNDLDKVDEQGQPFRGEAANDRRWWLQALGSLAAIGLVSWLALQHLNEPGAPQLDAPQMDSPAPPPPPAAADMAASPSSAKIRKEMPPMGSAASPAVEAAPQSAPAPAAGASAGAGASSANTRPSPASAPTAAPQAERRMAPAPASAPIAPPFEVRAASSMPPAAPAAPAAAAKQAAQEMRAAERPAPSLSAAPAAASASTAVPSLRPCAADMDAQALAEQRHRVQAYDKAITAGLPAPEAMPTCRPAPANEAEPAQPLDSR